MIKIELKRAFINRMFLIALVLGCLITVLQAAQNALPLAFYFELYPNQYPPSVYNSCLGLSLSVWNSIFYTVYPLLAAIPYADSFLTDRQSGYIKNIYTRVNRKDYLKGKFIAVFLSGGSVVLLPTLLNLLIVSLCVPSVIPDASTGLFPIFANFTGASLYYTYPLLYVFLYDLLIFFVGGCFAVTALIFSFAFKHRYVVVMSPFLLFMIISCVSSVISPHNALNISQWIVPSQQSQVLNIFAALAEMTVILATTGIVYYFKGTHDDAI